MTFEEAIEKINDLFIEPCTPGYSSGDFAPEFLGQIEDLEEIIEELQETYAPKIKMTKAQFDWFTIAIDLYDELEDVLGHRWETPTIAEDGYNDRVREIRLLDDKTLALAWLHPELIEVTDVI